MVSRKISSTGMHICRIKMQSQKHDDLQICQHKTQKIHLESWCTSHLLVLVLLHK